MFKILYSILLALTFLLIGGTLHGQADCSDNEFLVLLDDDTDIDEWMKRYGTQELSISRKLRAPWPLYLMSWDPTKIDINRFQSQLKSDQQVKAVQKNCLAELRNTSPDDPMFSEQWNLELIQADRLWDLTTGGLTAAGDTIVMAVLDSRADIDHEDLVDNIWHNRFEIDNDGIDNDNNGYIDDVNGLNIAQSTDDHVVGAHGTAVAGIMGATGNNGTGLSGVNWDAKLMVFTQVNSIDHAIEALLYCYEQRKRYNESNGAQGSFVVSTNYSLGFDLRCEDFPIWDLTYDSLGTVGILSVGATKNINADVDVLGDIPTSCASDFLITVTNVDESDTKVNFAGFGATTIDLGAPGNLAPSTFPADDYNTFSGTSSATPHVAGAIGLLYSIPCPGLMQAAKADPAGVAREVKAAIMDGVDPRNSLTTKTVSGGRLNVWSSFMELEAKYQEPRGALNLINISPNPTSGLVKIETMVPESGDYEYRILDSAGRSIYGGTISSFCQDLPLTLDLSFMRSGYFYFQLFNGDELKTLPLIIL